MLPFAWTFLERLKKNNNLHFIGNITAEKKIKHRFRIAFLGSLFHCGLWLKGLTFSINLFFLVDNFAIILHLHSVLFVCLLFFFGGGVLVFFQFILNDVYICLPLFIIALHIVLMNYSSLLSKSFLGLVYIGKRIWESFSELLLCHHRWNHGNINRKAVWVQKLKFHWILWHF